MSVQWWKLGWRFAFERWRHLTWRKYTHYNWYFSLMTKRRCEIINVCRRYWYCLKDNIITKFLNLVAFLIDFYLGSYYFVIKLERQPNDTITNCICELIALHFILLKHIVFNKKIKLRFYLNRYKNVFGVQIALHYVFLRQVPNFV